MSDGIPSKSFNGAAGLYGTAAERTAYGTSNLAPRTRWLEPGVGEFEWDGSSWVRISTNGGAHVTEGIVKASNDSTVVNLTGGLHYPLSVNANSIYRITPEVDCLYKTSGVTAAYSAWLDDGGSNAGRDYYTTGFVNFTSNDEIQILNTASTNYAATLLFRASLKENTANNCRLMFFGAVSSGASLDVYAYPLNGLVVMRITVKSNDATTLLDTGVITTTVNADELLHVFGFTIDRSAGTVILTIDGNQVGSYTYTDDTDTCTFTATNRKLNIGATAGDNAEWDGYYESVQFYKSALTLAQISARVAEWIPITASDLVSDKPVVIAPSFWANFANGTGFSCVSGYGTLSFSEGSDSSATVAVLPQGNGSKDSNSDKVYSGNSVNVSTGSDTYLSLYSIPGAAGKVRVTKIG